jgi:hypothetical protein
MLCTSCGQAQGKRISADQERDVLGSEFERATASSTALTSQAPNPLTGAPKARGMTTNPFAACKTKNVKRLATAHERSDISGARLG